MALLDPLENKLVALIGGSGFVGTHVAQELLARGARLRVASRNPEKAFRLKPLANPGQLQFARVNVADPASIAACVARADAVVYLVGTFGKDQRTAQAIGAGEAARAAAAAGARSFVYVSAIGADAAKEGGYFSTKGEGEDLVRAGFPAATIIRPSAVFGEESGFVPLFAQMVQMMPAVPVFGPEAKLQPVWVDDLAKAVGNALADPESHGGNIYEAAGPDVLSTTAIYQLMNDAQHRTRTLLPMPDAMARLVAALPFTPLSGDQLDMLKENNVATPGALGLKDLGIEAHPLELFLERWMVRYRKYGRFAGKKSPA
jgi:uncharacterized protein YbjT (DUF2867 family)